MKLLRFAGVICMVLSGCGTKSSESISLFDSNKLYKIVLPGGFTSGREADSVTLLPIDRDSGYIHAAKGGEQVDKVLSNFFGEVPNVVILELDSQVLHNSGLEVRMEQNKPGGTFYPHIYGQLAIPAAAVARVISGTKQADGVWKFALTTKA